MNKIFRLMKYMSYIELFESIGAAISHGKRGENFIVTRDVSVNGQPKHLLVSMSDAS